MGQLKKTFAHVESAWFIVVTLTLLLLPVQWLVATAMAAAVHELAHILAVILCGGRIGNIRIRAQGGLIQAELDGPFRRIIASLAGPAASLCLACLAKKFPRISFAALLQGIYNLLPVYPLDGGRAIDAAMDIFPRQIPKKKFLIREVIFAATVVLILVVSINLKSFLISGSLYPLIMEKYLAKKRKKGYNNATIEMR